MRKIKTIKLFSPEVELILGKQEIASNTHYRMLTFCIITHEENETLICNLLTRRWISVSANELELLEKGIDSSQINDVAREFIENWFMVPDEHDDLALCDEVRDFFKSIKPSNGKYSSYSIMTTLDCNARCFYCYQMGRNRSRSAMTVETAEAVCEFIKRTAASKKVFIQWYGGEPLYNDGVIDIISRNLLNDGFEIDSYMISNGYLLTDEVIKRARETWKLKRIQITLDGPEEVYNKVKAYIYKDDPSPYQRVLSNIERALKADIRVLLRVNLDMHNSKELYALVDEVIERFAGFKRFSIYASILYENSGPNNPQRDAEMRMELVDSLIAFEKYCMSKGLKISGVLGNKLMINRCMGDSNVTVTISPEGDLGKCDHMMATDVFGSIFSDDVDENMLSLWREKLNKKEDCIGCPVYTDCYRLKKCKDDGLGFCDASYRKLRLHEIERKLHREYLELQ